MGRIKQGLDYFPLNTDFMHDRIVRRVMKREGDSAFAVLLYTLSYIYSGEGYYITVTPDFCDELSDQLFSTDNEAVTRILNLFVEYGFFDVQLYRQYGILTSSDIQRQFLFITKRRNRQPIIADYCLLDEDQMADAIRSVKTIAGSQDAVTVSGDIVTETPDNVTETRDIATKTTHIKRKEKKRKENILPNPPSVEGGNEEEGERRSISDKEPVEGKKPADPPPAATKKKRELTQEDIDRMQPPADGMQRNFSGLVDNLRLYRIPPLEQYAIVLKSNYGVLGGEVWKGFCVLRQSAGKIKMPGRYLLSLLNK